MNLQSIEQLKENGFSGFKTMSELFIDDSCIPKVQGVYLVLNDTPDVDFLTIGTGGHFKGKNPNVTIEELKENWVENALIVYIGKAGGKGEATLRKRLNQYFRFGQGHNVGHWGGRYIWQLQNSNDLIVCWKPLPKEAPEEVESYMIESFKENYGKRPFANLRD